LGQAFAVFEVFGLAKLRISRLLSQKLKFWESPYLKQKSCPKNPSEVLQTALF
jgi:hypothetical protein